MGAVAVGHLQGQTIDLTIITHVEPLDFGNYADPDYYWGYDSKAFSDLFDKYKTTGNPKERAKLLGDIQRLLATDAANAFLFQLPQFAVAKKKLKGLWKDIADLRQRPGGAVLA